MAPVIKLNSGYDMPQVGFGLWKVDNAVCSDVVYNAIKAGYRLFDGACGKSRVPALPVPHDPTRRSSVGWAVCYDIVARVARRGGVRKRDWEQLPRPFAPLRPSPPHLRAVGWNGGVEFCRTPVRCRSMPVP